MAYAQENDASVSIPVIHLTICACAPQILTWRDYKAGKARHKTTVQNC